MSRSNTLNWEAFGSPEELKVAMGVPSKAIFVGYVVWLRSNDEFLVSLQRFPHKWHDGGSVGRVWTKYPMHAKVFSDHLEAARAAEPFGKGVPEVVHLFDMEDKLLVAFNL